MYKEAKTNLCSAPEPKREREKLRANQHSDQIEGKVVPISAGELHPATFDAPDGTSGCPSFSVTASAPTPG